MNKHMNNLQNHGARFIALLEAANNAHFFCGLARAAKPFDPGLCDLLQREYSMLKIEARKELINLK